VESALQVACQHAQQLHRLLAGGHARHRLLKQRQQRRGDGGGVVQQLAGRDCACGQVA
jgi:hypothetical protein